MFSKVIYTYHNNHKVFFFLVDRLRSKVVFNNFQSYHGSQFNYPSFNPHQNFTQQYFQAVGPFSTWTVWPLVDEEWCFMHWLLSNVWKNVGQTGVQTYNPCIDRQPVSLPEGLAGFSGAWFIWYITEKIIEGKKEITNNHFNCFKFRQ